MSDFLKSIGSIVVETITGRSSRSGRFNLVLTAIESGTLNGITKVFKASTFAADKASFQELVDKGKIPKCPVKGSRCSNKHFKATQNGKTVYLSDACGQVIRNVLSGKLTLDRLKQLAEKELNKETKKAA